MERYYDEKRIRYYIEKHHLTDILPDIASYGKDRLRLSRCRRGEVPYWQNESETLVFLVKGSVKNYAMTKNGQKLLLHISEEFQILRDLELLGIKNQIVVVEALQDPVFLEVNLKGIKEELMEDPMFLRPMLLQIGNKLAKTTVAQVMTAIYPLDARLSSYILQMSEKKPDGTLVFDENLVETAELLGSSYRHLLRILKSFCENGILKHDDRVYRVVNLDWLEKKASDQPIYGRFLQ